jgi:hypothetical protein
MNGQLRRIMGLVCLVWCAAGCGQLITPAPTATPQTTGSLFPNDTCAPPCWFGLTPGVSTMQEAVENFMNHPDVFDVRRLRGTITPEDIDTLVNVDTFQLQLFSTNRTGAITSNTSQLWGEDGIMTVLVVLFSMNMPFTLHEVIETMGQPDVIAHPPTGLAIFIDLFYSDSNVTISFLASLHECQTIDMLEDYSATHITYYRSIMDWVSMQNQGPDTLDTWTLIPNDTWATWLQNPPEGSCEAALADSDRAAGERRPFVTPSITP